MKKNLPNCPVEVTLLIISNKWRVLILRELFIKKRRFSELQKNLIGITQKVLTQNLRDLEKKGIVNRKVYPEVPPKVEYSLTELGYELKNILEEMYNFGEKFKNNYLGF